MADDLQSYKTLHAQVRDVTKTYQSGGRLFRALDDINLDIEAGKLVALLGPSGSGAEDSLSLSRLQSGLLCVQRSRVLRRQNHPPENDSGP